MSDIATFRIYANHARWQECEELLKESQIVNHCDKLGNTLLLDYTYENNTILSELLVRYGSDVNAFNCNGKSPLIHAAMNSSEKLVNLLLAHDANPNFARTNTRGEKIGSNALMFACEKDNLEIVKTLLSVTDINYKNDLKQTAFMYACKTPGEHQFNKIAEFVKNSDLKVDNYDIVGNNYLYILATQNNLPLIEKCVIDLGLYHPQFLRFLKAENGSQIKDSTIEHIKELYAKYEFKTSLESDLTPKAPQKRLKI